VRKNIERLEGYLETIDETDPYSAMAASESAQGGAAHIVYLK
jgi:hypothetical protein